MGWIIRGYSTVPETQIYDEADDWYNIGTKFLKNHQEQDGALDGYFSSSFRVYALQKAITEGAFDSATLSITLALVVLFIMTKRLISATFAAVQIALCVSCVTGIMVLLGWSLGIIESLVFSVAVGLSCDFAAHLAHAYTHQPVDPIISTTFPSNLPDLLLHMDDAARRAKGAITELGLTVWMGFITTFITGILLLTASTHFFYQFGLFLTTIIACSLMFSFCFLMPLLSVFGCLDSLIANHLMIGCDLPRESLVSNISRKLIKNGNSSKIVATNDSGDDNS